ncbi:MAG: hypothetical protein J6F30_00905 [Cellulosilyticum sp.]|nr:hypothetical protein [Cellulosilyticum sp.]
MVHLVYCDNTGKKGEHELDKILSGQKSMVVRSAAGRKIPHSRVFEEEINQVFADNEEKLALTEKQRARWHKKCICIVEFEKVEVVEPALEFEKQSNMDDWLIIEKIEDVLVGTSIPYNYEKSRF